MTDNQVIHLDEDSRRIIIGGDIDAENGTEILSHFLELEKSSYPIDIIFLGSDGGSWEIGQGLLDVILNSVNYVTTYCLGTNSSTSAMLFLAGDSRYLSPRATLMLHHGSLMLDDTYKEVINYTAIAKKEVEQDIKYLSERSNKPPSYWREKLSSGDCYLDVDKCIELGMVTEIGLPSWTI